MVEISPRHQKIIDSYEASHADSKLAMQMLNESGIYVAQQTVTNIWRKHNRYPSRLSLKVKQHLEEIVTVYNECKGNSNAASLKLAKSGISIHSDTVKAVWVKEGLKIIHGISEWYMPQILDSYEPSGGISITAKKLLHESGIDLHETTIAKVWNKNKLYPKSSERKVEQNLEQIIGMHGICKGNASWAVSKLTGLNLHVSRGAVIRAWNNAGLEAKGKMTNWDKYASEILESHDISGGNAQYALKYLKDKGIKISDATLFLYWKKHDMKASRSPYSPKEITSKILESHKTFLGSATRAAEYLTKQKIKICRAQVTDFWNEHGLKASGNYVINQILNTEIMNAHGASHGIVSDAQQLIKSKGMDVEKEVILRVWRKNSLNPISKAQYIEGKYLPEILEAYNTLNRDTWKATSYLSSQNIFLTDVGLMRIWKEHGLKLEPNISNKIKETGDIVIRSNMIFDRNVIRAREYLSHLDIELSYKDILEQWKGAHLDLMPAGGNHALLRTPESLDKILNAHTQTKGVALEALDLLQNQDVQITKGTLISFWKMYSLSYLNPRSESYDSEDLKLIMESYESSNGIVRKAKSILSDHGISISAPKLKEYWQSEGLKHHTDDEIITLPKIRSAVLDSYYQSSGHLGMATKYLSDQGYDIKKSHVKRVWMENHLLQRHERKTRQMPDTAPIEPIARNIDLDELIEQDGILVD